MDETSKGLSREVLDLHGTAGAVCGGHELVQVAWRWKAQARNNGTPIPEAVAARGRTAWQLCLSITNAPKSILLARKAHVVLGKLFKAPFLQLLCLSLEAIARTAVTGITRHGADHNIRLLL